MPPLATVRIPELPPLTSGVELDLQDKLPIYIVTENRTRRVTLQELNTFFALGGGGGGHAPVVTGGELVYVVPNSAAGTDTASIPSLAGLDFTLERSGMPMIPLLPDGSNGPSGTNKAEFEILNAGGFKLLQSGDELALNERFKLTIYSLIGGGPSTTISSFITGKKVVSTNVTLDAAADVNKVIQVRGLSTALTVTIPDIADMAANSFLIIETAINNTKPTKIQTTGGQYIYFNNGSKTAIYMHPGEVCWLYRDEDGLYIIGEFAEKYRQLAKPMAAYKVDMNQLLCKGQEVNRADFPRLWEYAQTLGSSLVSDTVWATPSVTVSGRTVLLPYRGCFSTGDGSTTFRIPDLMNMFLRGLKSDSGTDSERHLNKPGGYQDATVKVPDGVGGVKNPGTNTATSTDVSAGEIDIRNYYSISTGVETRPEGIGVLWVINV